MEFHRIDTASSCWARGRGFRSRNTPLLPIPSKRSGTSGTGTHTSGLGCNWRSARSGDFPELLERDWTLAKFKNASDYSRPLRQRQIPTVANSSSSSLRTVHTPISSDRFGITAHGATEPVSRFFKLDPSGICNTIRAGTASDSGAFHFSASHPSSFAALHHGSGGGSSALLPDWFRFHVTKWHGFRQVGNSVPPLLARAVALELLTTLEVKSDRSFGLHSAAENRNGSLLQLDMSDAAELFGVPRNVIPPRRRTSDEAYV